MKLEISQFSLPTLPTLQRVYRDAIYLVVLFSEEMTKLQFDSSFY
jgi:hypothetical protein